MCRMLKRLCCYSKAARVLALRELLERALFRSDNILFGAHIIEQDGICEKVLIKQNKKIVSCIPTFINIQCKLRLFFQNKTIPLTKHSSVFNGGIIGMGRRKSVAGDSLPIDSVSSNTCHLINVIKACCSLPEEHKYSDMSLDSMTLLSLLLVQFVSPNVMYNGLPWPEEEFSKVNCLFVK